MENYTIELIIGESKTRSRRCVQDLVKWTTTDNKGFIEQREITGRLLSVCLISYIMGIWLIKVNN